MYKEMTKTMLSVCNTDKYMKYGWANCCCQKWKCLRSWIEVASSAKGNEQGTNSFYTIMKMKTKEMWFCLNCTCIELNGVLAFNVKMCDARSEVTVLNKQWIQGAYRYAGKSAWHCANGVLGIVQMECLRRNKCSACDCTNCCDYDEDVLCW